MKKLAYSASLSVRVTKSGIQLKVSVQWRDISHLVLVRNTRLIKVYLGSYFRSFNEIEELIGLIASKEYEPLSRREDIGANNLEKMRSTMTATEIEDDSPSKPARLGKSIWKVMHRAQGFETRFGLKTTAVTSLLAVPAWLAQSNGWWDYYEAWWAVIVAWLIMAPR